MSQQDRDHLTHMFSGLSQDQIEKLVSVTQKLTEIMNVVGPDLMTIFLIDLAAQYLAFNNAPAYVANDMSSFLTEIFDNYRKQSQAIPHQSDMPPPPPPPRSMMN